MAPIDTTLLLKRQADLQALLLERLEPHIGWLASRLPDGWHAEVAAEAVRLESGALVARLTFSAGARVVSFDLAAPLVDQYDEAALERLLEAAS